MSPIFAQTYTFLLWVRNTGTSVCLKVPTFVTSMVDSVEPISADIGHFCWYRLIYIGIFWPIPIFQYRVKTCHFWVLTTENSQILLINLISMQFMKISVSVSVKIYRHFCRYIGIGRVVSVQHYWKWTICIKWDSKHISWIIRHLKF